MIFVATAEQVGQLNDRDLRTLVGLLCEREIVEAAHSPSSVTYGGDQNAGDGGIDVRVRLARDAPITGYVPRPATGFQVKSQDMPPQSIKDEMAPEGLLLESIKELGKQDGAYIIASSQSRVSDTYLTKRKNAMSDAISGVEEAEGLFLDFYDQQRLTTWVNQHPGLVAWLHDKTGNATRGWRPFKDWSSSPESTDEEYLVDDKVRVVGVRLKDSAGVSTSEGVDVIRNILAGPKGVVRLVGLSGVGKTRFVQALFDERIGSSPLDKAQVIYADASTSPDPSPTELAQRLINQKQRAVLVIDNCGAKLHAELVALVKKSDTLLSFITVEYDISDDEPEGTEVFKLEASSVELIEKILEKKFPALAAPSRSVVAEFSAGNARIAIALASTTREGESLVNLKDSELFARLFHQNKVADSELMSAGKALSLVYSFDGETLDGNDAELPLLGSLAQLSPEQLYKHCAELFRRNLVQKRGKWRAVLPHALAHRLAKLALEAIPYAKVETVFVNSGNPRLLKSFSKRIGDLHDTECAQKIAREWFGEGGLIGDIANLNELGIVLFENIAPVDMEVTLAAIEREADRNSEFFTAENDNRRRVVNVLRSIAYYPEYFLRCMALLAALARNETGERQDTFAKDVVESLFHVALSGTHAPPDMRAKVVCDWLAADDPKDHALGMAALNAMLKNDLFTSSYSFEFGSRTRDFGFYPYAQDDLRVWFSEAFGVIKPFAKSDHPQSAQIREIFALKFKSLCQYTEMIDELSELADQLNADGNWPRGWAAVRRTLKLGKGRLSKDNEAKLLALADRLAPRALPELIRVYALSKEWGALDLADIESGDDEKPFAARDKIAELCTDLGAQLAGDDNLMDELLPEILASDSRKTWSLGKGMAESGRPLIHIWTKITGAAVPEDTAQHGHSLLAGFIAGARAIDAGKVEEMLARALETETLHKMLIYLQANAGLGDGGVGRIKQALNLNTVPTYAYRQLAYGRVLDELEGKDLSDILLPLSKREGGLEISLDVLGMHIFGLKSSQRSITRDTRELGRILLSELDFKDGVKNRDHQLGQIAEACLSEPASRPTAEKLCNAMLAGIRACRLSSWDYNDLFDVLALTHPETFLNVFFENGYDEAVTSREIFRDLRHDKPCPLQNIPTNFLLDWANAGSSDRFPKLAQALQYAPDLEGNEPQDWTSKALALIAAAPSPVVVLEVFYDRFMPTSWSGSRADLMQKRMALLEKLSDHENEKVRGWASNKIPEFRERIARERDWEAKKRRDRDERFEW